MTRVNILPRGSNVSRTRAKESKPYGSETPCLAHRFGCHNFCCYQMATPAPSGAQRTEQGGCQSTRSMNSHSGRFPFPLLRVPGATTHKSSIAPFVFPLVCLVFMRFSTGPGIADHAGRSERKSAMGRRGYRRTHQLQLIGRPKRFTREKKIQ